MGVGGMSPDFLKDIPKDIPPLMTSSMLKSFPKVLRNSSTITASPKSSGGMLVLTGVPVGSGCREDGHAQGHVTHRECACTEEVRHASRIADSA
jgi:hypothetical protein